MKFTVVTDYFKRIEEESSRLGMTKLLAELLQETSPAQAAIVSYLSLGQLHPPYSSMQFNIAEEMMIRVVARVLDEDEAAVKRASKQQGDLGLVIAHGQWRKSTALTVHEVYDRLCAVQEIGGAGAQEKRIELLQALLEDLTPEAAQYVVRIVLGKLRLGFSDMTLIDALSWMEAGDKSLRTAIESAYNACADIGKIASAIRKDGVKKGLAHIHIEVGIPIRPAAAERCPSAAAVFEKLGPCVAQPKLDGFRLQVHLDKRTKKPKVHFFSRHLTDMSAMFPDLVHAIMALDVHDAICEGEAIVFDKNTGSFLPFQETVKRKRKHGVEQAAQEMPLQLFLFDLLYLDGQELIDEPHTERRKRLLKLIDTQKTDLVQVIEEKTIKNAQELKDYFLSNVAAGLEGLVVKRPDVVYQAGKRNFNWIKLKREEEGHLEDTIDCIVLGYYSGAGKRAGFGIGAFLVGIFNPDEDRFETIAKVGTGLSDADWVVFKKTCDKHAVAKQPKNVVCAKDLAPDVWAAPEIVVTVRADQITLSPLHTAGKKGDNPGYALRFPRFIGYRTDKGPEEVTTLEEIVHLYKDQMT